MDKKDIFFNYNNPLICYKVDENFLNRIPDWHFVMLKDNNRRQFYFEELKSKVKDKIVLDLGTGTGLLAHICLIHGAKKVIGIEGNLSLYKAARFLMKDYIKDKRFEIFHRNIFKLEKEDFNLEFHLVIHELFGPDGLSEKIFQMIQYLREKNIIYKDTPIFPSKFELKFRAAISNELDDNLRLDDFHGLELSKLNQITDCYPKLKAYSDVKNQNIEYLNIFFKKQFNLKSKDITFSESHKVEIPTDTTHIIQSLRIIGESESLDTDFKQGPSSWPNSFFKINQSTTKRSLLLKYQDRSLNFTLV